MASAGFGGLRRERHVAYAWRSFSLPRINKKELSLCSKQGAELGCGRWEKLGEKMLANLFLNMAGSMLSTANTTRRATEPKVRASVEEVSCWRVVPALE